MGRGFVAAHSKGHLAASDHPPRLAHFSISNPKSNPHPVPCQADFNGPSSLLLTAQPPTPPPLHPTTHTHTPLSTLFHPMPQADPYEPSKRSSHWLKLKKDYMDGLGDTFDVVPIGAFHGKGRRAGEAGISWEAPRAERRCSGSQRAATWARMSYDGPMHQAQTV